MPVIRALGTTVEVDLGDAIDPAEFAAAWTRCIPEDEASESGGPAAIVEARSTMSALTQAVTRTLIGQRRGQLLMLHAGAVCNVRTGDAVAFVAPGGTGKTTLTRLLGQRFGYITDETVGIEPHTWVIHPYPKPLSTRTAEGGFPKSEFGPDRLGLRKAHPEPRLTALLLLRRDESLLEPKWTRLDLFDAIVALTPETSSLDQLERPLHLLADLYEALGGIWLAEYREAHQLVEWMAQSLESK